MWYTVLIGALLEAAKSIVGRVLVGFGIGIASYAGVSALVDQVKSAAFGYLNSAAGVSQVSGYLGLLQVGTCFNILASAVLVRLTLSGLSSGTVKKWVTK